MDLFQSKRIAVWSCERGGRRGGQAPGRMWGFCDKQGSASRHGQLYGSGDNIFDFHLQWCISHIITLSTVGGRGSAREENFAVSKDLGRRTNWIFNDKLFIFINQNLTALNLQETYRHHFDPHPIIYWDTSSVILMPLKLQKRFGISCSGIRRVLNPVCHLEPSMWQATNVFVFFFFYQRFSQENMGNIASVTTQKKNVTKLFLSVWVSR